MPNAQNSQAGFTLIELIMVVMIASIVTVGATEFISLAVGSYIDTAGRDKMASTMVVASEKLVRDLRRALPNSVRVGGDATDNCVEFIPILSGSRYITVPLASAASTVSSVSHGNASIVSGHIVVYPIDTADLYSPTDAAPSSITGVTGSVPVGTNNVTISLGAAHQFVGDSPDKRIYSVAQPVAYCQPAGSDRVYRYANYGFNSVAVLPPTGGSKDVLLDDLDSAAPVSFDYASATLARNAVIGFELRASVNGETLLLGQEAQIRNVP